MSNRALQPISNLQRRSEIPFLSLHRKTLGCFSTTLRCPQHSPNKYCDLHKPSLASHRHQLLQPELCRECHPNQLMFHQSSWFAQELKLALTLRPAKQGCGEVWDVKGRAVMAGKRCKVDESGREKCRRSQGMNSCQLTEDSLSY